MKGERKGRRRNDSQMKVFFNEKVVDGGKEGGNNRLIDGRGKTLCLTNGKPRWQDGRKKEQTGRTVRRRWMGRVSCCLTNVSQACSSIPFQN